MSIKRKVEEKVFSYIEEHHMLQAGDRIVAGISGGADSVCLLFVLLEYAKKVPVSIAVVHVNHGIRKEAVADACYVEALCKQHNLPFFLKNADVREKAAAEKCSEEEAGRKVRYEVFKQIAVDFQGNKIAVAHNSNDRSETMLFHLFRGSGIRGLSSIRPVRENIIRPILCLERQEIEAYLEAIGQSYCQDATNAEDDYTRNRIRHHILPYAEKEIVTGCVGHMAQTADMLSRVDDFLEMHTENAMKACVEENEKSASIMINIPKFCIQHRVIQERILLNVIKKLTPCKKDISAVHVKALQALFSSETGKNISLPFSISARREYEKVILEIANSNEKIVEEKELMIETLWGNPTEVEFDEYTSFIFSLFPYEKNSKVPQNQYTKWFDYDKIEQSLTIRNRRIGDYLSIRNKEGGISRKSLKDYMITEKIPRTRRDNIPILAEKEHVLWLAGFRISEYYKINENTKHVLQVQLIGRDETEEENGGTH